MSDGLEEKLDRLFISRYAKQLADLNKNVYVSAKNNAGGFDVPVVIIGEGGGTIVNSPVKQDAFSLNPPAEVRLEQKDMLPYQAIYRIVVPREECEIAVNNPAYFNYLFDKIMTKALGNYKKTFGDENVVRFGTTYITATRPDGKSVFSNAADTHMELRLFGTWASDYENYT